MMVISGSTIADSDSNSLPTGNGSLAAREFRRARGCDMIKLRFRQGRHAYLIAAFSLLFAISPASAQRALQTPEEAATALADGIKSGTTREMMKVLGSDAEGIIFSG